MVDTKEDQLDIMEQEVKNLKKERNELVSKLDDLENRSRRNNLVFHGISESQNQNENCQNLITKELSLDDFKVERCHRTPSSRMNPAPGGCFTKMLSALRVVLKVNIYKI